MHAPRPAALADPLHDGLDRALQADVRALTDSELLEAVADVYRAESRVAALKAKLVAEVDARNAYASVGAQTASAYITHRCRVPRGAARHDVLLARSLRHLPETAAKLADGDIGEAGQPNRPPPSQPADGGLGRARRRAAVGRGGPPAVVPVHPRRRLLGATGRSRRHRR